MSKIKQNTYKRKRHISFRNVLSWITPTISTAILIVFFFLSISQTYNYKTFNFSQSMYGNKTLVHDSYDYAIMRVKKNKPIKGKDNVKSYNDLFNTFYYNMLISQTRYMFDNKVLDDKNNQITFFTQQTFSISNDLLLDEDGRKEGHYIDYGIFAAYYCDNDRVLEPQQKFYNPRFGCDSFIYISDNYADFLLESYGLTSYDELIKNKNNSAILKVNIDDKTSATFSINNILYTNKRQGKRTTDLYNYFGLIPSNIVAINAWSSLCFEFDLKANPFGINETLNYINKMGYNNENSTFTFSKYNSNDKCYKIDENLTSNFETINKGQLDILFIIICILLVIAEIFMLYFFYTKCIDEKTKLLSLAVSVGAFIIYGLLASFLPINPTISLIPIIFVISSLLLCGKEVTNCVKQAFNKVFRLKVKK